MIRFKITADRFAEATTVLEYLAVCNASLETIMRVAPRFVVDEHDQYIVSVVLDEDGDIKSFKDVSVAMLVMSKITPKRFKEKLAQQFTEAAKAIVDPPKAGDSDKQSKAEHDEPPAG